MVVDAFSSFLSYVPIKNMSNPVRFLEVIIRMYKNNDHHIKKKLKMDNQFNTSDIISYLDDHQIQHQFSLPFDHEYIGRIESNNHTAQDKLSCALPISSAKNKNYCYMH